MKFNRDSRSFQLEAKSAVCAIGRKQANKFYASLFRFLVAYLVTGLQCLFAVRSESNPDNGALYVNVRGGPSNSANLNNEPRNRNDRFGSFPLNSSKLSGQFNCLICPTKFCSKNNKSLYTQ